MTAAFEFKAPEGESFLRMLIVGTAGSGKTYSAMSFAQALAARLSQDQFAVIDTECRRSQLYRQTFDFRLCELPDFNPRNYIDAIKSAVKAGYRVIVIDSLSHAWVGQGGALALKDEATAKAGDNKFAAWKDVTPLWNELIETIMTAKAHILCTARSKTEWGQQEYKDRNGNTKSKPVKVGLTPVLRDGAEFEFTLVGYMDEDITMHVHKGCEALPKGSDIKLPDGSLMKGVLHWLSSFTQPPTRAEVQAALKAYAAKHGQDKALALLVDRTGRSVLVDVLPGSFRAVLDAIKADAPAAA